MPNLYNEAFYDKQSLDSFISAQQVLSLLIEMTAAPLRSMVDLGCGVGPWLAAARQLGITEIAGIDGDYVPRDRLMIPQSSFFPNNLSSPRNISIPQSKFDLAISLEVAEHLPTDAALNFVQKLCELSDLVLFSAALPFQGGHGHINENWASYWSGLFAKFGFVAQDCLRPLIWNNQKICWWYRQNLLVFVKSNRLAEIIKHPLSTSADMLDLVHPEQYLIGVHRCNTTIKSKLPKDIDYWHALQVDTEVKAPGYGAEFSYVEKTESSLLDLQAVKLDPKLMAHPVVFDALSCIEPQVQTQCHQSLVTTYKERVPDFICIGAQKSATTWLDQTLRNHGEQVWLPPIKELNFFNSLHFSAQSAFNGFWRRDTALKRLKQALNNNPNIDESWYKLLVHLTQKSIDDQWYRNLFGWAPTSKLAGEITPEYAQLPAQGIKHAMELNPELKVIFIVRNPVERAISHIKMVLRNLPKLDEAAILDLANSPSIQARGNYSQILDQWQDQVPVNQFQLAIYEALQVSAIEFAKPIFDFLGIKILEDKLPPGLIHVSDSNISAEIENKLRQLFSDFYADEIAIMKQKIPQLAKLWC